MTEEKLTLWEFDVDGLAVAMYQVESDCDLGKFIPTTTWKYIKSAFWTAEDDSVDDDDSWDDSYKDCDGDDDTQHPDDLTGYYLVTNKSTLGTAVRFGTITTTNRCTRKYGDAAVKCKRKGKRCCCILDRDGDKHKISGSCKN